MKNNAAQYTLTLLRIGLGWVFLWAFIDKLFGLGFATTPDKAWIVGGSPTMGFLKFGTTGPFKPLFEMIAGNFFVDWLFMLGLLGIGFALILGIGIRIAVNSGSLLLFLMWLAHLPPENNPVLDDHIIYIFVLILLGFSDTDKQLGLSAWWSKTKLVKQFPILK